MSRSLTEKERYWAAFNSGDTDNTGVMIGEAAGVVRDVQPAERIVEDMVAQAHALLAQSPQWIVG